MAKALGDDDLWALIEPLFPPTKPRRNKYPGRKPLNDRAALTRDRLGGGFSVSP